MLENEDKKIDIAKRIIKNELDSNIIKIKRFSNGYCHSVYYVKTDNNEIVIRITDKENKEYYSGSIKWLTELYNLGIPVPKLIKHGMYNDLYFTIISYIKGQDLGEVYHSLNDSQKREIVNELANIQIKIKYIPNNGLYGYPYSENNNAYNTWIEFLESLINRSYERIIKNKIFDIDVCSKITEIMNQFNEYFMEISPNAFLDDITTKNVLINNGKLSGIVDIDEICFGDSLLVIGLTNMALLSMKMETNYIDYWLEEIKANETQRKAVLFYTLLYCIDFMSEQGMKFNNDNIVSYNQEKVELLNTIYRQLINELLGE